MWTTLQNLCQRSTVLNKLHAGKKFYSSQIKDDERIVGYITRVGPNASDLKGRSVDIEDEEIAMTILSGLPDLF